MFLFDTLLDSDQDDATRTFAANVSGDTSSALSTLGVVAGQLCIILSGGGTPTSAGGGSWNFIDLGTVVVRNVFWKVLTSADIAGTITSSGSSVSGGWLLTFYRGPTTAPSVVKISGGAHLNTAAGFSRAPNHAGLIGFVVSKDGDGGVISAPATWSNVGSIGPFGNSGHIYQTAMLERLAPPNSAYANGQSFTYGDGGSGGSGFNFNLTVLELRR